MGEIKKIFPGTVFEKEFLDMPKDDPKQRCPDLTRAKELLKWSPEISLGDGLSRMLEWLKTQDLENLKLAGKPL